MPRALLASLLAPLCLLTACGTPPAISARMDDAAIRATLAQHCPPSSSQLQVSAALDDLHIRPGSRIAYPDTPFRGPVLLVRLFEDRGPWLDSEDADIKFLDISFAFSHDDHLQQTLLFRDRIRYVQGEPITSPGSPRRASHGTARAISLTDPATG